MSIIKIFLLSLLIGVAATSTAFAQTSTLDEVSFTVRHRPSPDARLELRGSNFTISAVYFSHLAPRACQPCTHNHNPNFFANLDLISSVPYAAGTVNGVVYTRLYLGYQLNLRNRQSLRIARLFGKNVKASAPVKLTGDLGVWQTSQDVGNPSRALVYLPNVTLNGNAIATLYSYPNNNGGRYYDDTLLYYNFSQSVAQAVEDDL